MILLKKPLSFKEYTVDAHIPLRLQRTARFPNILPFGVKWRMPASCPALLTTRSSASWESRKPRDFCAFYRKVTGFWYALLQLECGKNQELQNSAACESKYRLQALPCRWSAKAGLNRLLLSAYVCIVEPVLIAQTENVETFWQEKPI